MRSKQLIDSKFSTIRQDIGGGKKAIHLLLNLTGQFGQKDLFFFFKIQPLNYKISNRKNNGIIRY